ncbi:MAG: hypothetical protein ACYTGL_12235 [Planctomycetota bacterium]|jgi:hypothetical protein
MPDLVTHLASGYVAAIPLRQRRTLRLLFLLGVLLPDLLTRPFYILIPGSYDFVMPLHTPITYAFACWLLTQLFADCHLRATVLTGLLSGGALHFAADALQRQFFAGYLWLFPICRCETSWGLFWPEASMDYLPVTASAAAAIYISTRWHRPPAKNVL